MEGSTNYKHVTAIEIYVHEYGVLRSEFSTTSCLDQDSKNLKDDKRRFPTMATVWSGS